MISLPVQFSSSGLFSEKKDHDLVGLAAKPPIFQGKRFLQDRFMQSVWRRWSKSSSLSRRSSTASTCPIFRPGKLFLAEEPRCHRVHSFYRELLSSPRFSSNLSKLRQPERLYRAYSDTIYALSTPPGRAAIAVIRISGPGCVQVRFRVPPYQLFTDPVHFRYIALFVLGDPCPLLVLLLFENCMMLPLQARLALSSIPQLWFSISPPPTPSLEKMSSNCILMEGQLL